MLLYQKLIQHFINKSTILNKIIFLKIKVNICHFLKLIELILKFEMYVDVLKVVLLFIETYT